MQIFVNLCCRPYKFILHYITMKNYFHICVILLLAASAGCVKDEPTNHLLGTWEGETLKVVIFENDTISDVQEEVFPALLTIGVTGIFSFQQFGTPQTSGSWSQPSPDILVFSSAGDDSINWLILTLSETDLTLEGEKVVDSQGIESQTTLAFRRAARSF